MDKQAIAGLEKALEGIKEFLSALDKPKSIRELALSFEKTCDLVIAKAKNEGLLFIDGRFTIQLINNEEFVVLMNAYFQKTTGEWIVKNADPITFPLTKLDDVSIRELVARKKIEFELMDPINPRKPQEDLL